MRNRLACAALLCLVIPSAAVAAIHDVASITELKAALSAANPGDEIRIAYGVYTVRRADDAKHWFKRSGMANDPIRIIGMPGPAGERPVFDADVPVGGVPSDYAVERGIFYIWNYTNHYVIENLEFRNARGRSYYSNNAAAAYINGANITFRNCYSHHNDNGWFATTSASDTLLEHCETAYNGKLPGASGDMTHNHYVQSASMTVRGCYIHDSTEGQNFKSRCRSVVFEYNWVENAANYEWELASDNSNNSLMIGNVIIKRAGAGNNRTIGLSDGGTLSGTLTMINNTIVATTSSHRCFFSTAAASTNLVLYNNAFVGPSAMTFDPAYWSGSGNRTGSHNFFRTGTDVPAGITGSLFGTDPGVVDLAGKDYRLLPTSILRNAGVADPQYMTPGGTWQVRVPDTVYVPHRQTQVRLVDATPDIGAFEGSLWPGDIDNDGLVDVVDLLHFVASFGLGRGEPGYDPLCDLNGDGQVDQADLLMLVEDFGKP